MCIYVTRNDFMPSLDFQLHIIEGLGVRVV